MAQKIVSSPVQSTANAAADTVSANAMSADAIAIEACAQLIPIESVQKILNRSRASVYRYANTDTKILNPPFEPKCLNPEIRHDKEAPLLFHPNEVARFAQEVLGIKQVTVAVTPPAETETHRLLKAILSELQEVKQLLME